MEKAKKSKPKKQQDMDIAESGGGEGQNDTQHPAAAISSTKASASKYEEGKKPTKAEIKARKDQRRKERKKEQKEQGVTNKNPPQTAKKEEKTGNQDKPESKKRKATEEPKKKTHKKPRQLEKHQVKEINKRILEEGEKKRLIKVAELFDEIIQKGLKPTVHTFTHVITAIVRCGEVQKAKEYFDLMSDYNVTPNEVTYTAMMKGLCGEGMISQVIKMYDQMKSKNIKPNLRTVNTILRGCYRFGDVAMAERMFGELKTYGIEPDNTSYDYYIRALCQAGRVDEAWTLQAAMQEREMLHAPTFSILATASALAGQVKKAKEALKQVDASLGKLTASSKAAGYAQLQKEEVQSECQRVREYLSYVEKSPDSLQEYKIGGHDHVKLYYDETNNEVLNFELTFGNSNDTKMEICSGNGDWVISKAEEDENVNWVAVELRFDRVYQIWTKMIFKGLTNLLIVGGAAGTVFNNAVDDKSIKEIFVNYPEPRVWDQNTSYLIDEALLINVSPNNLVRQISATNCDQRKSFFSRSQNFFFGVFVRVCLGELHREYLPDPG
eukprot:TRINITY_DN2612_c0_g1_i2.p1 TRINITY_DN2612_c0_g1~~TRINITY_DN2612_c0_g1_i2.p1  ORF type:complete len:553 (+),score=167.33 TRINITY_DN2612_c0_g1_i2:43-1701(+)